MARFYESFDSFAVEYDFMASLRSKNDFFISNLSTYRGAALDIGCGSGILTLELAKYYDRVVGVDISQEMLAIARRKREAPNLEYIQMDANYLSLDWKFDLIVSAATFHHLQNLPVTLQTIKRLLNPQGKVVLLDNVSEVKTPTTLSYILGALKEFIPDCLQYGFRKAWRLFRFKISPSWLRHLASDQYWSSEKFKAIYSYVFPGCVFEKSGCFMGIIWEYK